MTNVTWRGDWFSQVQKVTQNFDPTRGYVTRYYFKAGSQEAMEATQQDFAAAGCVTTLTLEHGKGELEVEDGTQQYAIDSWSMQGNDLTIAGLSHPTITANFTDEQIAYVQSQIENPDAPAGATTSAIIAGILANNIFQNNTQLQNSILTTFIGLYFRGSTGFLRPQYVLRHTTNVSNRWLSTVADFNVMEIYSPAKLASEISAVGPGDVTEGGWIFPCPYQLQNEALMAATNLSDVYASVMTGPDANNYFLGWLKKPSTQTTSGFNRLDISQEYILDLWSVLYYPGTPGQTAYV